MYTHILAFGRKGKMCYYLWLAALESDREYGENPEYQNPESDYQNLIIRIRTLKYHHCTKIDTNVAMVRIRAPKL